MAQEKATSAKKGRLGTQFRGKLASDYGRRGKYASCLWYVYSPRTKKDWVLHSDLEYDHFVLTEADPTVKAINYSPEEIKIKCDGGDVACTTFDAEVVRNDDTVEWREVQSARDVASKNERQTEIQVTAAQRAGALYVRITEEQLHSNIILLQNLRRVLAWVAAARDRNLINQQLEIATILNARRSFVLGDLSTLSNTTDCSLHIAAVMQSILDGRLHSDIAIHPLSAATRVYCPIEGA